MNGAGRKATDIGMEYTREAESSSQQEAGKGGLRSDSQYEAAVSKRRGIVTYRPLHGAHAGVV
jgi:hypothetical protein